LLSFLPFLFVVNVISRHHQAYYPAQLRTWEAGTDCKAYGLVSMDVWIIIIVIFPKEETTLRLFIAAAVPLGFRFFHATDFEKIASARVASPVPGVESLLQFVLRIYTGMMDVWSKRSVKPCSSKRGA